MFVIFTIIATLITRCTGCIWGIQIHTGKCEGFVPRICSTVALTGDADFDEMQNPVVENAGEGL